MEEPEPVTERQRMEDPEPGTEGERMATVGRGGSRRRMATEGRWGTRRRTERPVMDGQWGLVSSPMESHMIPPTEAERQDMERRRQMENEMVAERRRMAVERRAERQQMEAERCTEAEGRRMVAERWRVEAEMRRMQPERQREREIPVRRQSAGTSMALSRRAEREAIAERESRMEKAEEEASRESEGASMVLSSWADRESESMVLSRRAEREVIAERESRMEKAEEQAERMKSRRQMLSRRRGRRLEMDERMEAEASRAELEREAKKAELELERDLDSQRMEAEMVEFEGLLAKLELEETERKTWMEAEKKMVDDCRRIFKVWWDARMLTKEQEYCETWSPRVGSSYVMAMWESWESENDYLFIEFYNSVCLEKSNELLSNNWRKKVEFGIRNFLRELQDVELMPYCNKYIDFRNYWEAKYGDQNGQFEDITKNRCMQFSCGPIPRYIFEGPQPTTLQVFSAWIEGSSCPLQLYGLIALRDFVDPQRNMIFNRKRNECQIITKEDPYLRLTGPTRSVVVDMNESMGPVTIEAELKVKGAVESEDKYIILDAISLPALVGTSLFELAGPHMKLGISLGAIQKSVEATIFIRVVDGTWPTGFHGRFVASTASIDCNEVILLEFSGDGEMKQSRHVVSVEASGILVVTLKAWRGEEVGSVIFNAVNGGRSFGTLNVGFCSVQVIVAWSLISPYAEELVPLEWKKLYNCGQANESSWK